MDAYAQSHDDADALFEPPSVDDLAEELSDSEEPPVRTFQANSLADFTEWVTLRARHGHDE